MAIKIQLPKEYNHEFTLQFLKRSPKENLHRVEQATVFKLLKINKEDVLVSIQLGGNKLIINGINKKLNKIDTTYINNYVNEWFDLESDLSKFYAFARKDDLLSPLIKKYYGYRIIGQPDLFESLAWAILGQQINLSFAYTLKQRFVENFGEQLIFKNNRYYHFPTPEVVSQLSDYDLLPLQFSRQKSKYIVNVAKEFASGSISKEKFNGLSLTELKEALMNVKGVGNWTANYAVMKTFRYPNAFPLEDAGVHNAIKNLLNLKEKPSIDRVKKIFKKYAGWEAYATLYLWKSL